ncbi:MAG: DUF3800 domain-containing protein [Nanoarchaeota archaeon]
MFKYIYIDESGDLGFNNKKSSRYFIISALIIDEPNDAKRIIKNARRNKFKKELKKTNELKANNSSKELRSYILTKINYIKNTSIFHIVLDKKEVRSSFLKSNKHKLYNFVAGKLVKNILMNNTDLYITIDKSKGKLFLINDFNQYFKEKLFERNSCLKCKISNSYSHNFAGLQLVDFIAWSVFRKYESLESFYNDKLRIEQEVFSVWY